MTTAFLTPTARRNNRQAVGFFLGDNLCFIQSTTNTMMFNTTAVTAAMLLHPIVGNSVIGCASHAASLSLFQHAPLGASSNRMAKAPTCWSHLRQRSAPCWTPTKSSLGLENTDKLSFISSTSIGATK